MVHFPDAQRPTPNRHTVSHLLPRRASAALVLTCAALAAAAQRSELVEVLPLTDEVLMVHFDDGYVDHHGAGETPEDDVVVAFPLDVAAAQTAATYTLESPDDAAYAVPTSPLRVQRKSKPTDFAGFCLADNGRDTCVNPVPDMALEHWLYLRLPSPLAEGSTYTLRLPGFGGDYAAVTWTYDSRTLRSEAVHVNQVGYVPQAGEKFGYVYHWLGDGGSLALRDLGRPRAFWLVDADTGAEAFAGEVAFRLDSTTQEIAYVDQAPPFGNLLRGSVWECDFSAFRQNGAYRLCVEGVGCSWPFAVHDSVYLAPWRLHCNGLYQQRSGIALEPAYTDQPRPAPHHPGLTPGFADRLKYSTVPVTAYEDYDNPAGQADAINAATLGSLEAWGWYQDAGDWDGYLGHAAVPMELLWLTEMHLGKWGDGQLLLPERGNGLPDLLDEALWLPRFYHRLRAELLAKGWGTGGVGGSRVFGDLNGDDSAPDGTLQGSWQDVDRDWIVSGEDPLVTYAYAGLAAHAALLLERLGATDPAGVDWAAEARAAYAWAAANTTPRDEDWDGESLPQLRLFASANLWRLTGEPGLETSFAIDLGAVEDDDLSAATLWAYAAYRAASDERAANAALLTEVKARISQGARFWGEAFRDDRSARWAGNWFLPLIIGQATTPLVQPVVVGHYFAAADEPDYADAYRDALYSTADYFLGNNPLNTTWTTGLGERSPRHVFNLDSWVLGGETPRRGVTPYGPWTDDFLGFFTFLAPYHPAWPFAHAYPRGEDAWPAHERWFDQRTAPLAAEYTVQQNMSPPILTYGYLYGLTAPDAPSPVRDARVAAPEALSVVPNPARGAITLAGFPGAESVLLRDALGREVRRLSPKPDGAWSLAGIAPGVYAAEARAGRRVAVGKLVVE